MGLGESYVGETKRPLAVRIKEHQKHTRLGETTRSGIAEHVWTSNTELSGQKLRCYIQGTTLAKTKIRGNCFHRK